MSEKSSPTQSTATVLRASAKQLRLKLDGSDREVLKRLEIADGLWQSLEGKSLPVVVHGDGPKAKVELADGWDSAKAPVKKTRTRSGSTKTKAATAATKQESADKADEVAEQSNSASKKPEQSEAAPKTRTRSRSSRGKKADDQQGDKPEQIEGKREGRGNERSNERAPRSRAPKVKPAGPDEQTILAGIAAATKILQNR